MYLAKYSILFLCIFTHEAYSGSESMPVPENVRTAKDLIVNADRRQEGDPIQNYQKALALLSKQGQMKPYEMLLLAQAYVGIGNAMRAKPEESQVYFNRAMMVLEQIPLQVKRDLANGMPQPEEKINEFVLSESIKVWEQVKNGLPPIN